MTTLIRLDLIDKSTLLMKYQTKKSVFPLIVSVLENTQQGTIYYDGKHDNYFIIHKFGFADLIETTESEEFDTCLLHFLLERKFLNEKIRWFNVPEKWVIKLNNLRDENIKLVERVQLVRDSVALANKPYMDQTIFVEQITASNYDRVDSNFNVSLGTRFWSSKQQFLNDSFGIVVYKNDAPISLCYACAIANNTAEVDIITKEAYRSQGLGKLALAVFINTCITKKIKAHWDCYTNNEPSFALAKSFCFDPYYFYQHAIISK